MKEVTKPVIIEENKETFVSDDAIEGLLIAGVTPKGLALAKTIVISAYLEGRITSNNLSIKRLSGELEK